MKRSDLISDNYLKSQKVLHSLGKGEYGDSTKNDVLSKLTALSVKNTIDSCRHYIQKPTYSILDYGCGKGTFEKYLREVELEIESYHKYDPAYPEYGNPIKSDIVICKDVLEHIEMDKLDNVLKHIFDCTKKFAIFIPCHRLAKKFLSDGRNAHINISSRTWWFEKLSKYFDVVSMAPTTIGHPNIATTYGCVKKSFWSNWPEKSIVDSEYSIDDNCVYDNNLIKRSDLTERLKNGDDDFLYI